MESPELEQDVSRWLELKPLKAEFDALDKAIKEPLKKQGILNAVIGSKYQIVGRVQKRTTYDTKMLTDEQRQAIKTDSECTIYKIAALDK